MSSLSIWFPKSFIFLIYSHFTIRLRRSFSFFFSYKLIFIVLFFFSIPFSFFSSKSSNIIYIIFINITTLFTRIRFSRFPRNKSSLIILPNTQAFFSIILSIGIVFIVWFVIHFISQFFIIISNFSITSLPVISINIFPVSFSVSTSS